MTDAPNDCQIVVRPVQSGWRLESPYLAAPLVYFSGRKAEENARLLGAAVAAGGHDVRVFIYDRTEALVGTWRYFGDSDPIGNIEPMLSAPSER